MPDDSQKQDKQSQETQAAGKESEESTKEQLQLATDQGEAYGKALEAMRKETGRGASQQAQDYKVTLTAEKAEGMYVWQNGQLSWQDPEQDNAHVEVAVQDVHDGRPVAYLELAAAVYDESGSDELFQVPLPPLWHPWLEHYGADVQLPGDGKYTFEIRISVLPLMRHDKQNGNRFARPVTVRFEQFEIATGQKKA